MLIKPSVRKQQRMTFHKKVRQPVMSHCVPPAINATKRVHRIKEGLAELVLAKPNAGSAHHTNPQIVSHVSHTTWNFAKTYQIEISNS